jgi:hypothetical protein
MSCGVCALDVDRFPGVPCVTASGRHWSSLDDDDSPMPDVLRIAFTRPELRTTAEQRTLDGCS